MAELTDIRETVRERYANAAIVKGYLRWGPGGRRFKSYLPIGGDPR